MANSTDELWLPVVDWQGFYEVSDLARVQSLDRTIIQIIRGEEVIAHLKGRVLKQSKKRARSGKSYNVVTLSDTASGRRRVALVAHLVLEAFRGPRPVGMECCHWDDDEDDRLPNLRWDTHQANINDQVRNGCHASQVRAREVWNNV